VTLHKTYSDRPTNHIVCHAGDPFRSRSVTPKPCRATRGMATSSEGASATLGGSHLNRWRISYLTRAGQAPLVRQDLRRITVNCLRTPIGAGICVARLDVKGRVIEANNDFIRLFGGSAAGNRGS